MQGLYILKILINPFIILPPLVLGSVLFFLTYFFLKRERARSLVDPGRRASEWTTVEGEPTDLYYDIDKACTSLNDMQKVARWYVDNIEELKKKIGLDSLAFIERDAGPVGAITKKDLISFMTGIPSFVVRPKRRISSSVIKGTETVAGQKVVVISDVATTGASIQRVVDILESRKAKVVSAITILNRGGDSVKKAFEKKSIEFRFAAKLSDLEGNPVTSYAH